MAEATEPRRVVTPLAAASGRACSRPGCPAPARATMSMAYTDKRVVLAPLANDPSPADYDLCGTHASRTSPPYGWELADDRSAADRAGAPARTLGGPDTVAVLAAALQREPTGAAPDEAVAASPVASGPRAVPDVGPAPRPVLAARETADEAAPEAPEPAPEPADVTADADRAALHAALAEIAGDDGDPNADTETYLREIEAIAERVGREISADGSPDADVELLSLPVDAAEAAVAVDGPRAEAW